MRGSQMTKRAWKSSSSYRVCFHMNDGTDVKMNQVILRNKEDGG